MFKKILQSLSKSQRAKTEAPKPQLAPVAKSASASQSQAAKAAPVSTTPKKPEELCEITPKMAKDQIQAQLKLLYRRYNRSASSLDPKTRGDAERMLDAIVQVREKYFGEI